MKNNTGHDVMIGKDVAWAESEGHAFRVEHFLPLATVERGKVKAFSPTMPYASLTVDCPAFRLEGARILLPVLHKVDFRHLWELYQERGVTAEEEVIVSYEPQRRGWRKVFGKTFPHLCIQVRLKGSLEEIYRMDEWEDTLETLERVRAIAEWDPIRGRTK